MHAKAKGSPSYRFYALYDKVYRRDVLEFAYAAASQRRSSGSGRPDVRGHRGVRLERWLDELAEELREKTYRPQPVRRVYIPKAGRQAAAVGHPDDPGPRGADGGVLVLEPIFEADLQPEQYAYRPDRSALDAVQAGPQLLNTGHTEVVDADLSGYFDSIPHAELMKSVARRVSDGSCCI